MRMRGRVEIRFERCKSVANCRCPMCVVISVVILLSTAEDQIPNIQFQALNCIYNTYLIPRVGPFRWECNDVVENDEVAVAAVVGAVSILLVMTPVSKLSCLGKTAVDVVANSVFENKNGLVFEREVLSNFCLFTVVFTMTAGDVVELEGPTEFTVRRDLIRQFYNYVIFCQTNKLKL